MRRIVFKYDNEIYRGEVIPDKSFWGNHKVISGNMIISYNLIKKQIIKIDMLLREQISKDYMIAFKAKNTVAKGLLSVVKGEIQTIEKNKVRELTDEEVMAILLKTAKSLKETIKYGGLQAKLELAIIESYLPTQMSREEVTVKITSMIDSGVTQMGIVMKEFAGFNDKKMVSEIFKELTK
jgi:uncharacterized protein YqeY